MKRSSNFRAPDSNTWRFTIDLVAPGLGTRRDIGSRSAADHSDYWRQLRRAVAEGEILNNGADWQILTADGTAIIDTRYLLKLDDGSLAYLQTRGYRDR
jgi:hypothetical protein